MLTKSNGAGFHMAPKFTNPPADRPEWISASLIKPRATSWLWYPYIPFGNITVIYGRGGAGKSQVTCAIAAAVSSGEPLPGSGHRSDCDPQNVIMLSAEDNYEEVLVPRLISSGAKLKNITIPKKKWTLDGSGLKFLTEAITEFGAGVVTIDPIVYYAGGKMDINKSNEVRAMMEKIKETIEGTRTAILIVGHTRKQEGRDQDMMMGSADWINAARSALYATETNDGTRILRHPKNNNGPEGPPISYTLGDDGFEWGDIYLENDLPKKGKGKRVAQAVSFLKFFLANGPMKAKDLESAATDAEIAPATINRAKIGVAESFFSKSNKCWMWKLCTTEPEPGATEPKSEGEA